jgi:hypothetical protein
MLVTAQECPRRLDDWSTAWRREHPIDRRIGPAASVWALGVAAVSLPQAAREARPLLLGSIRLPRWSRACARSLARKILNSLGARALPGSFVDISQTEGHHPMRNGSADKTSGEDPAS